MKLFSTVTLPVDHPSRIPFRRRYEAAFTLTELALCIAVVGIALVAIIGVLPSGLLVQRQNREDTLITEDAKYLMEAIRSGGIGIPDLTNYIEEVRWIRQFPNGQMATNFFRGINHPDALSGGVPLIIDSRILIGMLSSPREEFFNPMNPNTAQMQTNRVQAIFRSFGSAFTDKPYADLGAVRPSPTRLEGAFRYLVTCESRPVATRPPFLAAGGQGTGPIRFQQQIELDGSLHEIVLRFQWPVFRVGNEYRVGNGQKVFRSQVHAGREILLSNFAGGLTLTRFIPGVGRQAQHLRID